MEHEVWHTLQRNNYTEAGAQKMEEIYDFLRKLEGDISTRRLATLFDYWDRYQADTFKILRGMIPVPELEETSFFSVDQQPSSRPELFKFEACTGGMKVVKYIGDEENVVIPSSVGESPVVEIGVLSFSMSKVKSVVIPEGVRRIEAAAFTRCHELMSVGLPSTLLMFGDKAFSGCSKLNSIKIPAKVRVISYSLFENCIQLRNVSLPDTIEVIQENAFHNCENLTDIKLPDSLERIEDYAFVGSGLAQVTIPKRVCQIGMSAFLKCHNLAEVRIDNVNADIGQCAFSDCCNLNLMAHPEDFTSVGFGAFNGTPYEFAFKDLYNR